MIADLELVHRFFSGTGSTYDQMVCLCTVGFDQWWKKKIIAKIPPHPRRIIDQACGTGILTFKIARRFPFCRILGVELRKEYLNLAIEKARADRLGNVEFILGRAEDVILKPSVDCITSSYLAKYAELEGLIQTAGKMLRAGGRLIMHDFTYPPGRLFSRVWVFYFKLLQILGARIYPQWRTIFYELPELIRTRGWAVEAIEILKENDFADIGLESFTLGTAAIVSAVKN
jgi:demethylmenaquinone methyltransferase/2-methoxy-6-polyprenyl-1,4-benzoquinol methylase